ncbi:hypothetical protein Droror1_Dr00025021 [Drosera rotundifolia]
MVLARLASSLSDTILPQVIHCSSAREIWQTLEVLYSTLSRARIQSVRRELHSLIKGTLSISAYVHNARALSCMLTLAGEPVSDPNLIYLLLGGLPSEFDSVVASIQLANPLPSIDIVSATLGDFELRLQAQQSHTISTVAFTATIDSPKITLGPTIGRGNREPVSSSRRGAGSFTRGRGNPNRGRGRPRAAPITGDASSVYCYRCGYPNHKANAREAPPSAVAAAQAFHLKQYSIMPKSLPVNGIQRGLQLKLSFGRREQCVLMAKCKGSDGEVGKESEGEGGGEGGEGLTYKDASVDIDARAELVKRIAKMADGIGGFGGVFLLVNSFVGFVKDVVSYGDSYLVPGTDGVGTKLKLAFETGMHDTIGIDLVAMSVNDIVTSGAKPLFFLDYFATSRLDVDLAERVIKGIIVNGCQQSDCVLLGGETSEMPDFYKNGEYDLSGFVVGIVKKDSVIDGKNIEPEMVLQKSRLSLNDKLPGESTSLGEVLMAPTVIYVKQVLDIISRGGVKGIAHITGGGFIDNIPRVFPKGIGACISTGSWPILPVFKWIQEAATLDIEGSRQPSGDLSRSCRYKRAIEKIVRVVINRASVEIAMLLFLFFFSIPKKVSIRVFPVRLTDFRSLVPFSFPISSSSLDLHLIVPTAAILLRIVFPLNSSVSRSVVESVVRRVSLDCLKEIWIAWWRKLGFGCSWCLVSRAEIIKVLVVCGGVARVCCRVLAAGLIWVFD